MELPESWDRFKKPFRIGQRCHVRETEMNRAHWRVW